MPLPVPEFRRMGVDGYLNFVSTLFGRTESVNEKIAAYRIHGANLGPVSTVFTAESLQQRMRLIEITQDHLLDWASRLGYVMPVEVLQLWNRGWRHCLLHYSLAEMDDLPQRVGFGEFVSSPFYSRHTNRLRALFLSALLGVLWWLPRGPALGLARYLLKLPKPAS